MVIIIMHKGLAYRKGSGGRGIFYFIFFLFFYNRSEILNDSVQLWLITEIQEGHKWGLSIYKGSRELQGTLKHLKARVSRRKFHPRVFFSRAVLFGLAWQNASLELLSESQSLSGTFYLWSTGATVIRAVFMPDFCMHAITSNRWRTWGRSVH